jgi:hypothetical protein
MDTILQPTRIYTELLELYEKFPHHIFGVAHITGGGFHDNIRRILPENLNYELDEWEFPPIFKWIQKESGLNRQEMLNIFNCGYGMVIISSANLPLQKIGRLVKKNKEIVPTWADSLSKNIIESATLEIGNPVDDGYNYIKQVHTNEEITLETGKAAYEQWGPIPDDVIANILEAEDKLKQVIANEEFKKK